VFPPSFLPDLVSVETRYPIFGTEDRSLDADRIPYALPSSYVTIPVLNLANSWAQVSFSSPDSQNTGVKLCGVGGGSNSTRLGDGSLCSSSLLQFVAPGQLTSIPLQLYLAADSAAGEKGGVLHLRKEDCPLTFSLSVKAVVTNLLKSSSSVSFSVPLSFRCRRIKESFVFTFLDRDGSVSRAAAIAPLPSSAHDEKTCASHLSENFGPPRSGACGNLVPVVLSLHGTGVEPGNQVCHARQLSERGEKRELLSSFSFMLYLPAKNKTPSLPLSTLA
jgi:hypothetical protein